MVKYILCAASIVGTSVLIIILGGMIGYHQMPPDSEGSRAGGATVGVILSLVFLIGTGFLGAALYDNAERAKKRQARGHDDGCTCYDCRF